MVDFSYTPGPTLHVASFCTNNIFSSVLSIFREGVRIEPHITFRVVFVQPNPKLIPTTNP